jgi:hypothetical protein
MRKIIDRQIVREREIEKEKRLVKQAGGAACAIFQGVNNNGRKKIGKKGISGNLSVQLM